MRDAGTIAAELHTARIDAHRAMEGETVGKPVYRATPGCTRYCDRCDIRCAVLVGRMVHLENELDKAISSAPTTQQAGPFFVSTEGNC